VAAARRGRARGGAGRADPGPGLARAWVVWTLAASAYFVAIFHRAALGVAGLQAADRLHIAQGSLSILIGLQLVVYLLMQIPAGLAADRIGPRRTLAIGLAFMAAGEVVFAPATGLPAGLLGRALVGVGDGLTFLSVLRIAHAWFPERMQALLAALTGFAGALGQIVATVPLSAALDHLGWVATFLGGGAFTAAFVLVPLVAVRDRPPGVAPHPVEAHEPIGSTLRAAWARPATRHGFGVHFGCMGPFAVVTALWGVPYMVAAQHMSRHTAASFLLVAVAAFAATGALLGLVVGDSFRRQNRASMVLPALTLVAWVLLVAWPGATVPRAVLAGAMVLTGVSGGGAMLSFELARRDAPAVSSGSATAIVNCGGFSAAVGAALAIGALIGDGGDAVHAQHAMIPVAVIAAVGAGFTARAAWRRGERAGAAPRAARGAG
jgi:sugar phosphate permease